MPPLVSDHDLPLADEASSARGAVSLSFMVGDLIATADAEAALRIVSSPTEVPAGSDAKAGLFGGGSALSCCRSALPGALVASTGMGLAAACPE